MAMPRPSTPGSGKKTLRFLNAQEAVAVAIEELEQPIEKGLVGLFRRSASGANRQLRARHFSWVGISKDGSSAAWTNAGQIRKTAVKAKTHFIARCPFCKVLSSN